MSNVPSKSQPTNPIPRFPRSPTAEYIGNLAKKIWKRPKFRVKQTSDSTEFIFSLTFNVIKKIKKRELASYYLLFDPKRTDLTKALVQAYKKSYSGSKKVRKLCEWALYKVFAESLGILFEEAGRTEGSYKGILRGDAKAVLAAAKRRRPPDLKRKPYAMRLAKRYEELLPKMKELRAFVRDYPHRSDQQKLKDAVEARFLEEWISLVIGDCALTNLPVVPGHSNKAESLGALTWTPRQLAVGIIWCEEQCRDERLFDVQPNTILEVYLPLGRKANRESK